MGGYTLEYYSEFELKRTRLQHSKGLLDSVSQSSLL